MIHEFDTWHGARAYAEEQARSMGVPFGMLGMLNGCDIPDPDDIASCLRTCRADADACGDLAQSRYIETQDKVMFVEESQDCFSAAIECVAQCAEDM